MGEEQTTRDAYLSVARDIRPSVSQVYVIHCYLLSWLSTCHLIMISVSYSLAGTTAGYKSNLYFFNIVTLMGPRRRFLHFPGCPCWTQGMGRQFCLEATAVNLLSLTSPWSHPDKWSQNSITFILVLFFLICSCCYFLLSICTSNRQFLNNNLKHVILS